MPPHASAKSPVSWRLRSAVHGEWSLTTMSMSPLASAAQRASRLAASRIGGQHLSSVAPSAIEPASKCEVVRAGLDADVDARGAGRAQRRHGARTR